MAQVSIMSSPNSNAGRSDLPDNQFQSKIKSPTMGAGTKVAINAGIQIGKQVITKALSQAGSLYGNNIQQKNINNAITLVGYGAQIASTGVIGVVMVAGQLGYQAFQNNLQQQRAVNKVNYAKSTVGYIANGNGRYGQ